MFLDFCFSVFKNLCWCFVFSIFEFSNHYRFGNFDVVIGAEIVHEDWMASAVEKVFFTTTKQIYKIDDYKFNGDLLEAQMFAYIGVRSIKKLILSSKSTTGVKKSISGGKFYKFNN